MPPTIDLRHVAVPRVPVAARLAHLRELLRGGTFSFDEAVRGADRMTVAVTLFALLELYKRGEADWEQGESFGDDRDSRRLRAGARRRRGAGWGGSPGERRGGRRLAARAHGRGAAVPVLGSAQPGGAGRGHPGRRGPGAGGARAARRAVRARALGDLPARARGRLDAEQRSSRRGRRATAVQPCARRAR